MSMNRNQRYRPFAHHVDDLRVGDIVYWDDRTGWRGVIVALPSATTLDVDYLDEDDRKFDQDRNIDRSMFTVRR